VFLLKPLGEHILNLTMNFLDKSRRILKSKFDLIRNENLKKNLLNALPFWAGAFVSGGVAVWYAKLFSWAEVGMNHIYEKTSWAFFFITPACLFWLGGLFQNMHLMQEVAAYLKLVQLLN
jgi:hypothetical protein